ncbi:hypothetical protein C5E11_03980 [Clavibacter michiganensis]|nr:hypothetical protein [Clavibacter michiganensis]PPF64557.1 hypothetical protein C5E11_03980 [Clavibacter michiganensis]
MSDYPTGVLPATTTACLFPGCSDAPKLLGAYARRVIAGRPPTMKPRPAIPGTDLCGIHHHEFAQHLRELVTIIPQLHLSVLRTPKKELRERVQTSGVSDGGALWNPAATVTLNNITEWTQIVVRRVLEQRPLPEPGSVSYQFPESKIGTRLIGPPARRVLVKSSHGLTVHTDPRLALMALHLHHARWLSSYPGVAVALVQGARSLMVQAWRALDAQPMRRITLRATCGFIIEETEYGEIACEGTLYGLVPVDGDPRPTSIVCATNPAHRIDRPGDKLWLDIL